MPSGRRISSPWTTISMIRVMVGSGGDAVQFTADRNADNDADASRVRAAVT